MYRIPPFVLGVTGAETQARRKIAGWFAATGIPVFDGAGELSALSRLSSLVAEVGGDGVGADPDQLWTAAAGRLWTRFSAFLGANDEFPLVVLDAERLFALSWDERCDAVLFVFAGDLDEEVPIERLAFLVDIAMPADALSARLEQVFHKLAEMADERLNRVRRGFGRRPGEGG